jgi:hypothetical protein
VNDELLYLRVIYEDKRGNVTEADYQIKPFELTTPHLAIPHLTLFVEKASFNNDPGQVDTSFVHIDVTEVRSDMSREPADLGSIQLHIGKDVTQKSAQWCDGKHQVRLLIGRREEFLL